MSNRTKTCLTVLLALCAMWLSPQAHGQAFNIDLDIFFGDPPLGNGAPSSSFGAAAGQTGFWNRSAFVGLNQIADVNGVSTGVTLNCQLASGGGIGFFNSANTGDFALLLNDAAQVASVVSGGTARFTIQSLLPGDYQVFTYAVRPQGTYTEAPIRVASAKANQTQVVTGPMPGNAFEYLITHSVHDVAIELGDSIVVEVEQQPFTTLPFYVNGFQIVPVPETNSLVMTAGFCIAFLAMRVRSQRKTME